MELRVTRTCSKTISLKAWEWVDTKRMTGSILVQPLLQTDRFTLVNAKTAKSMVEAYRSGPIVHAMKECGRMIRQTEWAHSFMRTEMYTKECG